MSATAAAPEIQSALTTAQWRSAILARGNRHERQALVDAAINLHEHPQGFTWHDVDILNDMAAGADQDAAREGAYEGCELAATSLIDRATALRSLAQRIGALLAPRA